MIDTLHLNLKFEWYDKIASGQKTSEYREPKAYWNKRFCGREDMSNIIGLRVYSYENVVFHRGYTSETMEFEIDCILYHRIPNDLNIPVVWEIKLGKRIK